jgi:hypothetical protein
MKRLSLLLGLSVLLGLCCAPAPAAPNIVAFSISPTEISEGGSATLLWNITGATSVDIDNGIGQVDAAGTKVVSPSTTTVYNLTAKNTTASVSKSAVVVINKVPTSPSIPTQPTSPPNTGIPLSVDVWTNVGGQGPNTPGGTITVGQQVIVYISSTSTCEAVLLLNGPYTLTQDLGTVSAGIHQLSFGLAESKDIGIWNVILQASTDGQQASDATTFIVEAPSGPGQSGPAPTVPVVDNGYGFTFKIPFIYLNGNLISDGGAATSITIYWGTSDGGTNPSGWANNIPLGTKPVGTFFTRVEYSFVTEGTTYYYRCCATNSAGSAWAPTSAILKITPTPPPPPISVPAAPSNCVANQTGSIFNVYPINQVTVTWRDNSNNEDGFKIYVQVAGVGPWVYRDTVGPNATSDDMKSFSPINPATGLPGLRYYFRVTAYNSAGESAPSNSDYATVSY